MHRLTCLLVVGTTVAACAPPAKDPAQQRFAVTTSDGAGVPGIAYGTTSAPIAVAARQTGWLQFAGNKGDSVDIWVRSPIGDAVAWLVDDSDAVVAENDDAAFDTSDAHLAATLPADGTYRIGFADWAGQRARFTVALAGSGVFSCAIDSDCVAVDRAGCCHNGWLEAVAASSVERYQSLYACTVHNQMCTDHIVQDNRVAVCDRAAHRCAMMAPTDIVCGGLAPAHVCPSGFACQPEGPGQDRLGRCVAAQ